jgi:hypothetical protein
MRYLFLLLSLLAFSCNSNQKQITALEARIDSLQQQVKDNYHPGLGEMMSGIQVHHNKLWFAGKNSNWELADFEIHEIVETIDAIEKFQQDRKEIKAIGMIRPALDSLTDAISKKDPVSFQRTYSVLTATCNTCHQAVQFGFNVVKVPETPPFSNQDFKAIR